jgi:hypothetical protein
MQSRQQAFIEQVRIIEQFKGDVAEVPQHAQPGAILQFDNLAGFAFLNAVENCLDDLQAGLNR